MYIWDKHSVHYFMKFHFKMVAHNQYVVVCDFITFVCTDWVYLLLLWCLNNNIIIIIIHENVRCIL